MALMSMATSMHAPFSMQDSAYNIHACLKQSSYLVMTEAIGIYVSTRRENEIGFSIAALFAHETEIVSDESDGDVVEQLIEFQKLYIREDRRTVDIGATTKKMMP